MSSPENRFSETKKKLDNLTSGYDDCEELTALDVVNILESLITTFIEEIESEKRA